MKSKIISIFLEVDLYIHLKYIFVSQHWSRSTVQRLSCLRMVLEVLHILRGADVTVLTVRRRIVSA